MPTIVENRQIQHIEGDQGLWQQKVLQEVLNRNETICEDLAINGSLFASLFCLYNIATRTVTITNLDLDLIRHQVLLVVYLFVLSKYIGGPGASCSPESSCTILCLFGYYVSSI
jgi:hypothetical protein